MNAFYEHHKSSIEFVYRCFDRILLNGRIQPFQQPERVLGFFNYLSGWETGNPSAPHRDCRPLPPSGYQLFRRDGEHPSSKPRSRSDATILCCRTCKRIVGPSFLQDCALGRRIFNRRSIYEKQIQPSLS
jgi:hypothetical protein